MNSMFYLIRTNRRDKPHSRTGNDNVAKTNSWLGNKRANCNYRERGPGNAKEVSTGACGAQTRAAGQGNSAAIRSSCPSPFFITGRPACSVPGGRGRVWPPGSWWAGVRASRGPPLPGPLGKLTPYRSQASQRCVPEHIREKDLAGLETGHLITQQLLSTPPALHQPPHPGPPHPTGPSPLPWLWAHQPHL